VGDDVSPHVPMDEASALRRIVAEADIRDAVARYARAVDRRHERILRGCFHDDAHVHYGVYDGGVEGFVDWVLDEVSGYTATMHFLGQSVVDWIGEPGLSAAIVETYAMAMHRLSGGERGRNWIGGIRYVDRFERHVDAAGGGGWRIAERTVVGDWLRLDPTDLQRRFGGEILIGQPGRGDIVCRLLGQDKG